MTEKQLPPELVEKMRTKIENCNSSHSDFNEMYAKKCAHIAVDYAEEIQQIANDLSLDQLRLIESNRKLEEQKKELVQALIITNNRLQMALVNPEYNSFIERNKQLIEKYIKV